MVTGKCMIIVCFLSMNVPGSRAEIVTASLCESGMDTWLRARRIACYGPADRH
jgi:hypothetical protein